MLSADSFFYKSKIDLCLGALKALRRTWLHRLILRVFFFFRISQKCYCKAVLAVEVIWILSVICNYLTLCMLGKICMLFYLFIVCGFFFFNFFFQNYLSGIPSECQTIWIQIWVQTVCKGYQQMTKVATSGERVRYAIIWHFRINVVCACCSYHYEKHAYLNILEILPPKNENFQIKKSDIFQISAQNIDCGYLLEPPSVRRF